MIIQLRGERRISISPGGFGGVSPPLLVAVAPRRSSGPGGRGRFGSRPLVGGVA